MKNGKCINNNEKSLISDKIKLIKKYFKYGAIIILLISVLILRLKFKINLVISLIISLIIIILIIAYFILKLYQIIEKAGYKENWNDLYGMKILNIPYFKDDKIINTFKKEEINYNEEIGDINNGNDYQKNERNYYDLFIPYSSLKKKDKYNGIILTIHAGGWIKGKKKDTHFLCIRYAKYGYIMATMNHTLLIKKYKEYNIFRIIDEITSCIESIKNKLKDEGFDTNKLELAIGGLSAGAHLSLLYGYSIKNSPIPIKFVINFVGPISLEPQFWYKVGKNLKPLESIEPKDIEISLKYNKIIKVFEDETILLNFMNAFIGNKYSDNEIKEMMINNKINIDNEKYKEMLKIVKHAFPINFINSDTVPTLCQYGGKDQLVGVVQYSYLKKLSEEYGNKVELVYMKDADHSLISYDTQDGLNAMREMHYQILNFSKSYFTSEN